MKNSLMMFFLLLMFLSAGVIKSSSIRTSPPNLFHKRGIGVNSRKLMGFNALLDYDYAGPNPKHDPRGRKGGGGGRGP